LAVTSDSSTVHGIPVVYKDRTAKVLQFLAGEEALTAVFREFVDLLAIGLYRSLGCTLMDEDDQR
jgi:hypothetical protein